MKRAIAAGVVMGLLGVVVGCGNPPKNPPPPPAVDAGAPDSGVVAVVDDSADWLLLVDFDAIPPTAPVAKPETFAKYTDGTFKKWAKTKKECTGKGDAMIAVDGGYDGEFTTKGAKETLYLVNVTPCDAKAAPSHNLLVLEGTKVKLNQTIPEDDIVSVKDLDLDGDQEIVVVTTAAPYKARLIDTEDAKYEQLYDFGALPQGSCDGGKASGDTPVIKYKKRDTGVTYKVDSHPKACAGGGAGAPAPATSGSAAAAPASSGSAAAKK